jgi:tetratricopeptide (TPR) repeat protein
MARNRTRHGTRLSVLFIAAILIPGGFLAYFSIRNIGSQKQLAEKRLLDEEGILAEKLQGFLHDELLRCAKAFFAAADQGYPDLRKSAVEPDLKAYVAQPFALDASGLFLWPNYAETSGSGDNSPESARYSTAYSQAQKAEFSANNLQEAAKLYREASKAAANPERHADAINGLARVLAKSNQSEQAAGQYEILLERYGASGMRMEFRLRAMPCISLPGSPRRVRQQPCAG